MSVERAGAYAVALVAGKVLVFETPHGVYLPGDGVDAAETPQDALRREVREETGYTVEAPRRVGAARQYVGAETARTNKLEEFFAVTLVDHSAGGAEPDHRARLLPVAVATAALAEPAQAWAVRLVTGDDHLERLSETDTASGESGGPAAPSDQVSG